MLIFNILDLFHNFYIANIRYIFYQPTYLYRFYVFFNVQMHEAPGELPRRWLFL